MNTTNASFAVVAPENGLPTVVNKNSVLYWEFMQIGHCTLTEGNKRWCDQYAEQFMEEILLIQY